MKPELLQQVEQGNPKAIARAISFIENETGNYDELLEQLTYSATKIIGFTGPPGAGKSTLVDVLIGIMVRQNKKVAVLCIDPSSPFTQGALLGDRIRMSQWYNEPNVFIRSLASRRNMGGLHPMIIEITEILKAAPFDYIIIETVGVGQSEMEIAGLADTTVVVLVPEAGDDIQTMKAGLMEIADIFVVNKADRQGADMLVKNLHNMVSTASEAQEKNSPIIKTIATQNIGIDDLMKELTAHEMSEKMNDKKLWLLVEKAYQLIQRKRMRDIDKDTLFEKMKTAYNCKQLNLYQLVKSL